MEKSALSGIDYLIDITRDRCPMTFVKTRLALDKMQSGEKLEVLLQGAEPLENVPRSARELGHAVGPAEDAGEGRRRLIIRKA